MKSDNRSSNEFKVVYVKNRIGLASFVNVLKIGLFSTNIMYNFYHTSIIHIVTLQKMNINLFTARLLLVLSSVLSYVLLRCHYQKQSFILKRHV